MSKDDYETPIWIKTLFKDYFDPCPINPTFNGLQIEWEKRNFVNPPYSNPDLWVDKAIEENRKGKLVVLLLRHDHSTKWFSKLHNEGAHFLLINERVHFSNTKNSPNFCSTLAILNEVDKS